MDLTLDWPHFAGAFFGAVLIASILTPIAQWSAHRFDVMDHPSGHKSHSSPVPYLGGVAIVATYSLVVGLITVLFVHGSTRSEMVLLLVIGCTLALLGLWDDLQTVPWTVRLIVQTACALGVDQSIEGVSFTGVAFLDSCITIIWIVGLVNAVNMTDNMDGLSSGLVFACAGAYFFVARANGQFLVAALAASLAGCAAGFFWFNKTPAKIYMGDAGSYFLGFMTAFIGIKIRFLEVESSTTNAVPVVICAVLLFDATFVTVTRLVTGRSPFVGGRDHSSHRLVSKGLSIRSAVAALHSAGIVCGWLGYLVSRSSPETGWLIVVSLSVVLFFSGINLAQVRITR